MTEREAKHDVYSTDGPICPYCDHWHRPDEAFFYDEGTDRLECYECDRPFAVRVFTVTSWTTDPLKEVTP